MDHSKPNKYVWICPLIDCNHPEMTVFLDFIRQVINWLTFYVKLQALT